MPEQLLGQAQRLYAVVPNEFTATRNAAAKAAKQEGDADLAAALGALRKPAAAAWAINLLVRREAEQIDQALGMAESLRAAAEALDGDGLRALTRQRRQLTSALATRARQLAQEAGVRISGSVAEQVEATLTAAMLDADAAEAVRTGLLVGPLSVPPATSYDELVAVPSALGTRIEPDPSDPGPALHAVPTDPGIRREAAREELQRAETEVAGAEDEVAQRDHDLEELQGRALQLRSEVDELQRRIGELEESAEDVEEQVEEAETARDEARDLLAEAVRARDDARAALDALGR
ncbi:hypothetical protein GCM10011519_09760 [Marmoricola endophyticus]|uniref:Uncharacterized protein n=1 Tax=Marmoricola endophyticus TaxID=2040280 RepID=A0A917F0F4_9ACTN|nr:hypothetical protein [Marmoricola endophyticus]GGF38232.1 hypothetical protein GCM10011519_09760 [Marmoricola endophyticus]